MLVLGQGKIETQKDKPAGVVEDVKKRKGPQLADPSFPAELGNEERAPARFRFKVNIWAQPNVGHTLLGDTSAKQSGECPLERWHNRYDRNNRHVALPNNRFRRQGPPIF